MSDIAIQRFLNELAELKHRSGKPNESSIRLAFIKLLGEYAKAKDLRLVPEVPVKGKLGKNVTPDGTLKDTLVLDWGYWESKDEFDDLEKEIAGKFAKGYPDDNILFEDSAHAVLYQNGRRVAECKMEDVPKLDKLLKQFVNFERPEVHEFRVAIELFKADVPKVTEALRTMIETNAEQNRAYQKARNSFLDLLREVVNPNITPEDIREMVIQHILTADIFNTIFDEPYFHQDNNIARELEKLVATFFTREVRNSCLAGIKHYYDTINARAAQIADHHEKQRFLKVVYETFYKSYSPKKADRLGVVYTPNEIVRFMIDSTDYLLQKHFGKMLQDKGVEILDPATGTGTFICDIIDHIRKDKLEYKYKHELHANEVEILPYYIANLNIEFTYKQKMSSYAEFENLCFVDTLDNYVNFREAGETYANFVSDENAKRINRQNISKISVIIGNPPYNANQMNENENNKNREYPKIDKRIKNTYIKHSTAQKAKSYDMYRRFYRWAMDRIDENGIIAFITNRNYIDAREADGFRKCVQDEFDYAYIIDTKSDVRQNPKIAGTTHNVFGIQTGVAIMFLIKKHKRDNSACRIQYITMQDEWRKEDKLQWLTESKLESIPFEHIQPDKDNNWIDLVENDWEEMMPVADKAVKNSTNKVGVIFDLFSNGIVTARDEWVYDVDRESTIKKAKYFIDFFNNEKARWLCSDRQTKVNDFVDRSIKWTEELESHLTRNSMLEFDESRIRPSFYRPFVKQHTYCDRIITHRVYQQDAIFPIQYPTFDNYVMCFVSGSRLDFGLISTNILPNYAVFSLDPAQCLPLYRYDQDGNRHDNITDWALAEFRAHYADAAISKTDIFHYVYAVLHHPAYRAKYELNLKRSFPRIPYYDGFRTWAEWGKELMELHIGFEAVEPYPLTRIDTELDTIGTPKAKLKADKEHGSIILDEVTSLTGIPQLAWDYKLGNRSALEWVLDQYKEKKPKDPTIAKLFNTYRFADYKEKVIDLLMRVCTVSVKTMEIVQQMESTE
ncbi:MAG: DNA methyltransferase [Candidatus Cloacimonetes bacterium HGW-Cloacimonetes-2]|jgi:predicted helicase|nr:MAG: DNA methyltransferase [Candidatus Cloacimonetes bacterium HGW-Cloacimonetes-2]